MPQIDSRQKNLCIVNSTDKGFREAWQSFQGDYPMYSYRYQLPILEYCKMMSDKVIDQSFVIRNLDTSLVISPLIFEEFEGNFQGSMHNGQSLLTPLFHPGLSVKQTRALEDVVFDEIKARMAKNNVNRLFVDADFMSVGFENIEDQMLARFGGVDISSLHHIMDLTLNKEKFWQQIRHSSKSIINRGLKTYEFKVYDKENFSKEIGKRHAELHHKTAGRITRPLATFDKMYSWVENDCGLMFEQLFNDQVVQMILIALGKGVAVGASAADDPDFNVEVPLTHSMNYFIYQETKRRGIRYFDVGDTSFRSNIHKLYTEKELKINYFKRGFGSRSYPIKRWIWFPNPESEIEYYEKRLLKYKEFLLAN